MISYAGGFLSWASSWGKYLFGGIMVQVSHHDNLVLIDACNGFSRIVDDLETEEK
jgi:hypothetical protein